MWSMHKGFRPAERPCDSCARVFTRLSGHVINVQSPFSWLSGHVINAQSLFSRLKIDLDM